MFHLAPHSTLNTSTSSLSPTSPVLMSSSSANPDLLSTNPFIQCEDPRQDGTSTGFHSSTKSGRYFLSPWSRAVTCSMSRSPEEYKDLDLLGDGLREMLLLSACLVRQQIRVIRQSWRRLKKFTHFSRCRVDLGSSLRCSHLAFGLCSCPLLSGSHLFDVFVA